jgi:effector-binding domain-containing protein
VSAIQQELDKEIELHKKKIVELEQLKLDQEKKIEGFNEFEQTIKRLCNQMALTEAELYVSRGDQILAWVESMGKAEKPGRIYETLKKHFEKTLKKDSRKEGRKDKVSTLPKPKLAVGCYNNPATHETIEKIKRNPRQLEDWINEYGFETVRTWKV